MVIQRLVRHSMLVAGGAAVIALTAACSGQVHATGTLTPAAPASPQVGSNGSTGSPVGSTSTGSGGSTSSSGTGSTAQSSGSTQAQPASDVCKASDLKLSLGQPNGAAGSSIVPLQFTNTGSTSCVLEGYPGVSYVGGNNGQQIGAAATRTSPSNGSPAVSLVTLAPGAMASANVQEADSQNYPASQCNAVSARGLRVYAPGDTAAMFVAFSASSPECSNPSDTGLSVEAIESGSGN